MKSIEVRESDTSRCLRSARNASTTTSCIWESLPPVNEPARPGIKAITRQNPADRASAGHPSLRNSFLEYSCFRILSRTRNPSMGRVN